MIKEWLKNYKTNGLLEILIILVVIFVSSILFSAHSLQILSDRGREFIVPQAILSGKIPIKDILLLYFPLAYYLNAGFFAIAGVSINALLSAGTINCAIFSIVFFYLAKEFFDNKFSLLITLLITQSCLFTLSLFSFVLPYSYSMAYGVTASITAVLFLIKYWKSGNKTYLFFGTFFAGTALSFKLEFLPLTIVFVTTVLYFKRLTLKDLFKVLGIFAIMPALSFLILIIQGVTISDLKNAYDFMCRFSATDSMHKYIADTGSLPVFNAERCSVYIQSITGVSLFMILCTIVTLLWQKFQNKLVTTISFILVFILCFVLTEPYIYTTLMPLLVFILCILNYKKIIGNPVLLTLVLSGFALSLRTIFAMRMHHYGTYTFPVLFLALCVLIFEVYPQIKKIDMKHLVSFAAGIYLVFFLVMNISTKGFCAYPTGSENGIVYLPESQSKPLVQAMIEIEKYTKPTNRVLVLPEGSILNFWTNRPLDLKLHMLDRLYYDAFNKNEALELIKNADYEMIVIVKGLDLFDFGKTYLYGENNEITKYIKDNYTIVSEISEGTENQIICLKRKR